MHSLIGHYTDALATNYYIQLKKKESLQNKNKCKSIKYIYTSDFDLLSLSEDKRFASKLSN